MGYLIVIINSLLYLLVLGKYWRKNKVFDVGVFLLLIYTLSALMCTYNFYRLPNYYTLTLWPFLYLFITLMVAFRPFLIKSSVLSTRVDMEGFVMLKPFTYLFIICGLIAIYFSVSDVYKALFLSDWGEILQDAYSGNVAALYHNPVERICKNICGYTNALAIIVGFYYITEKQKKYILATVLLTICVLLNVATNVVNGSRGFVAHVTIQMVMGFLLFKPFIETSVRRKILVGGGFMIGLVVVYAILMTLFRFEKATTDTFDGPLESLIYYFGHSMLTFSNGLVDKIHTFMWGKYVFGSVYEHTTLDLDALTGTTASGSFYTFIGALYYDFGPIGTFLVVLLFSAFQYQLVRKKRVGLAEFYLYVYFLFFVADGFLVIGSGYWLSVVMAFVLYFLIRLFQKGANNYHR